MAMTTETMRSYLAGAGLTVQLRILGVEVAEGRALVEAEVLQVISPQAPEDLGSPIRFRVRLWAHGGAPGQSSTHESDLQPGHVIEAYLDPNGEGSPDFHALHVHPIDEVSLYAQYLRLLDDELSSRSAPGRRGFWAWIGRLVR